MSRPEQRCGFAYRVARDDFVLVLCQLGAGHEGPHCELGPELSAVPFPPGVAIFERKACPMCGRMPR
jgi:hypothetical protein